MPYSDQGRGLRESDLWSSGLPALNRDATGKPVGVFCFHPDTFEPCIDGSDVEFWPSTSGSRFNWEQLASDSREWCCGWPVDRGYEVGERVAFVAALLHAEVIDLPRRL